MSIRAIASAILIVGMGLVAVPAAFAQSSAFVTPPSATDAPAIAAPAAGAADDTAPADTPPPAAITSGHCAVWSAAPEDDAGSTNLTATACSSTADDSTAIGIQCPSAGQVRYYPQADDLPKGIKRGSKESLDFAVDTDHVVKAMQYDDVNGVFFGPLKKAEPLLTLLQSGGPLIVSNADLGSHTFRLLGSTAAMQLVFDGCAHPPVAAPVPVPPPPPRAPVAAPDDEGDGFFGPADQVDGPPSRTRRPQSQPRKFLFPFFFGQ